MGAISNNILTITEPSIELESFEIVDIESGNEGSDGPGGEDRQTKKDNLSKFTGGTYPAIRVNGYDFNRENILAFELRLSGIVPRMSVSVNDSKGLFNNGQYPKDGDTLSLYIRSNDEEIYKPIRIDFDIVELDAPPLDKISQASPGDRDTNPNVSLAIYTFECRMKIPGLFKDICKSYNNTMFSTLEEISTELKLGFASNVDDTSDTMPRICAYDSRINFIKEQMLTAYKTDNHFFLCHIDPYYYLNLVDINNQLKYDEDMEDSLAGFAMDLTDDANYGGESNVGESKLYLTNLSKNHSNTDKFIKAYSLKNNSATVTSINGYKRNMKYYDQATKEYLEFIVEPLTSENLPQGLAPLKGRNDEDRYNDEVKVKYVGKQSSNVHENFLFSQVHNFQNITELEKLYLEVELEKANLGLYRYQKIPILIYNDNISRTENKRQKEERAENESGANGDVEGSAIKSENADNTSDQYGAPQLDKYLTGSYVIADITYEYDKSMLAIKQRLKLYRREWPNPI